jgi:predicted short-subunit dehydrogenase-like oxidoreductase (DUF2520 family)
VLLEELVGSFLRFGQVQHIAEARAAPALDAHAQADLLRIQLLLLDDVLISRAAVSERTIPAAVVSGVVVVSAAMRAPSF